ETRANGDKENQRNNLGNREEVNRPGAEFDAPIIDNAEANHEQESDGFDGVRLVEYGVKVGQVRADAIGDRRPAKHGRYPGDPADAETDPRPKGFPRIHIRSA